MYESISHTRKHGSIIYNDKKILGKFRVSVPQADTDWVNYIKAATVKPPTPPNTESFIHSLKMNSGPKKAWKEKNKAAPAWTSTGPYRQLSTPAPSVLLALPPTAEGKQTSPSHPSSCNPPQKHKPTIYYKIFSADPEDIPASPQSSRAAQLSLPLLPGLGRQKLGCAGRE